MGVATYFLWHFVHDGWLYDASQNDHWFSILCGLAIVVPVACVIYALALVALRYQEIAELYNLAKSKFKR